MYIFNPLLSSADNPSSAPIIEPLLVDNGPLAPELLERMNRYWYAANYLCVGQIYLKANPLLREPLSADHIKPRLLGHWGTSAGQNFIYVHLNRLISEQHIQMIYIFRPRSRRSNVECVCLVGRHLQRRSPRDHRR